jgi:hypothetical protein
MDSRGAPERVRGGQAEDQRFDLGVDGRATAGRSAGEPRPVLTEAAALPPQDGGGRYDQEGPSPPRPQLGQRDPEHAVRPAKSRSSDRALVHGELLAQGEVFESELAVSAAEDREESKQVEQRANRGTAIVSGSEPEDQPLIRWTGFWRWTPARRSAASRRTAS